MKTRTLFQLVACVGGDGVGGPFGMTNFTALGMGGYQGYSALGVAAAYLSFSGRYNLNAGFSHASGNSGVFRVGVGASFF